MRYFYVEPEVAGGFGENTIMDTSVHPPKVSRLHYEFHGWLGDMLLESFPSFIVPEEVARRLLENHATGVHFAHVEVSTSDQFEELYPGMRLPEFAWLQVFGRPGKDDFGIAIDHRLVISERALDLLQASRLTHASIEPFQSPDPSNCKRASRGIPQNLNAKVLLEMLRREWNEFYRENPSTTTTREQVLQKVAEIDAKYGSLFNPPVRQSH